MTRISFRMQGAAQTAGRLERSFSQAALRRAAIDAVNAVVAKAQETILKGSTEDLALDPAYVASKTSVVLATSRPHAELRTVGDTTILGRYPIQQLYKPALGKAKGDPKRGIPAGMKQAGLAVTIRRSIPSAQGGRWFTMTLREGQRAGSKIGVFERVRPNQVVHRYGLSPYSLTRFQIGKHLAKFEADLEARVAQAVGEVEP